MRELREHFALTLVALGTLGIILGLFLGTGSGLTYFGSGILLLFLSILILGG